MRNGLWMIVIWFQVMGSSVWANQTTEWSQGKLFLQNGTEFTGEINFNWAAQVVQCRQGAIIKAYSAFQVRTFTYFDEPQLTLRKFACLTMQDKTGHQQLQILEEMVAGSFVVYRQVHYLRDLIRVSRVSGLRTYGELAKNVDNFAYWVLSSDLLIGFPEFYQRVWPQVSSLYGSELEKNARHMVWGVNSTIGRLQQISVYNALAKEALLK